MSFISSIQAARRSVVHKSGKRALQSLFEFQGRHSLTEATPFLANGNFPFVTELEANWRLIRSELDAVLNHREEIPSFHELSPDQARISSGDNWKTFVFFAVGEKINVNCAQCPNTTALLERLPTLENAWFSILAPGYHIIPHRGPTRALIRCHLGLMVPQDRQNCWIRVASEVRNWEEGKCMLFDDTYEHEVKNDTDEWRTVLFLDFDRPMDRLGTFVNTLILRAIKSSHYFKDPMVNIKKWQDRTSMWGAPD